MEPLLPREDGGRRCREAADEGASMPTPSSGLRPPSPPRLRVREKGIAVTLLLLLAACATAPSPQPRPLGAGFRYSAYGPPYNPGPEYWALVGHEMARRFPNAHPETIWIVSRLHGSGTLLNFPASA